MAGLLKKHAGKEVVIDTDSGWVYIGTLKGSDNFCITLENADAFDYAETSLSKHEYIMLVKNDGVAPNRKELDILKNRVVAITLLSDILDK